MDQSREGRNLGGSDDVRRRDEAMVIWLPIIGTAGADHANTTPRYM